MKKSGLYERLAECVARLWVQVEESSKGSPRPVYCITEEGRKLMLPAPWGGYILTITEVQQYQDPAKRIDRVTVAFNPNGPGIFRRYGTRPVKNSPAGIPVVAEGRTIKVTRWGVCSRCKMPAMFAAVPLRCQHCGGTLDAVPASQD